MNYPLISEYIEAIKAAEENFEQLKHLRPVLGEDGEPVMTSGNFAVVFKMKDSQTEKLHAVKCFLKEQEGRAEAYRMIAEELEHISSKYLTPIRYLDDELFVDTQNSGETEFPVLLMDWVEGETLDKYVIKNKYDGAKLSSLVRSFHDLSIWLLSQPFAHGDLKPDNIIVTEDDNLVLVDYDGMYVPEMFGLEAREQGSPNYRTPNKDKMANEFCKRIDDFAIIHIMLSLRVYSLFPQHLSKENDFAIFNYDELSNISISPIFKEILADNTDQNTCTLLVLFQKCIYGNDISLTDLKLLDFSVNEELYINLEEQMCSLDNILYAMNLAYSSMMYKDPARNEYEINEYRDITQRISLATEIQDNLRNHEWPYDFNGIRYSRLKQNGIDYREGVVLELTEYTLRYLYGLIKYNKEKESIPTNVYSGSIDVFTLSYDEYKYESQLDEFVKIQESYSQQYKYLYVFDIRNFFKSINKQKMIDCYFGKSFTNVEWFDLLFSKLIEKEKVEGINPCSEVDFFFANIYLRPLDEELTKCEGIKYLRCCDDLRIFSNKDNLLPSLTNRIQTVLSTLSLKINTDKTKVIDTTKDKLELATACFVWSDRLYLGLKNAKTLLSGKSLADIINNNLTTTYIFQLLNDIDDNAKHSYWYSTSHIDPLFYILKNVHKNANFYRIVSELIFEIGRNYEKYDAEIMGLPPSILEKTVCTLKDNNVEPFVKYWLIRTFFCSEKNYYRWYANDKGAGRYCYDYLCQIIDIVESDFRKDDSDALLSHLSDFIISIIEPDGTYTENEKVKLPF